MPDVFTEFCCRSGGSNLNAGTRLGDTTEPATAAALTYASGSWVQATCVFTVAAGNPLTDGVAVGDYASVYPDAASETPFVGRVTARDATTITVSTTAKAGTAPVNGANNTTLKIGGAWLGPNGASAFPFNLGTLVGLANAATNLPRVNLKNDQTYSVTAAITMTGANVNAQGYTTSYGDLGRATIDGGVAGASYILFTCATAKQVIADIIFQNNGASGASDLVSVTSNNIALRCVFAHGRRAGILGASAGAAIACEAYDCNQSNTGSIASFINLQVCYNCIAHDSQSGTNCHGFQGVSSVVNCIADTNGGKGFFNNGWCINCDAYNNTSDGFYNGSNINCNSVKNTGVGYLVQATNQIFDYNCFYGAGTQANTGGATSFSANSNSYTSNLSALANDVTPWTDPANGDFRINLAACEQTGYGTFTETAAAYSGTVGYPDVGAAQAFISAAVGAVIFAFDQVGAHISKAMKVIGY